MRQCLGNGYGRELPCSQQTQAPSEGGTEGREGRLEDGRKEVEGEEKSEQIILAHIIRLCCHGD